MFTKTTIKYSDIATLITIAEDFKLTSAEKRNSVTLKYLKELKNSFDLAHPNDLITIELDTETDIKHFVYLIKNKTFGKKFNGAEKRHMEIWKLEEVIMELAEKHSIS